MMVICDSHILYTYDKNHDITAYNVKSGQKILLFNEKIYAFIYHSPSFMYINQHKQISSGPHAGQKVHESYYIKKPNLTYPRLNLFLLFLQCLKIRNFRIPRLVKWRILKSFKK
jgi:hypothetical protein